MEAVCWLPCKFRIYFEKDFRALSIRLITFLLSLAFLPQIGGVQIVGMVFQTRSS